MKNIVSILMLNNATISDNLAGTVSNIFGLLLVIAAALLIVVILLGLAHSLDSFRRFKKIFKIIESSINYALYGLLTVIIVGAPSALVYYTFTVASTNVSGSLEVLKWIGIIGGAYIAVVLVGYVTKNRIWRKIASFMEEDKKEEPKEKIA